MLHVKNSISNRIFYRNEEEMQNQTSLPNWVFFVPLPFLSVGTINKMWDQIGPFLPNQAHTLENIRVAQLTPKVKNSWSIFLWSMVGRKWARHTKSQQCLTTQAVPHPVDHLIKPIMALHLHVLLHGWVQAILSVFRSMKLDVNLHFWAC